MKYEFTSIFTVEMDDYLSLMQASGKYMLKAQSTLRSLDKYLVNTKMLHKELKPDIISAWLKTRNVGAVTKGQDCVNVNGFCKYLSSLGFEAHCPERPKTNSNYTPYVFSDDEFDRIVCAADNFSPNRFVKNAHLFPVLLRILYGCGLRLGEGRTLCWNDVDLANGILTIRDAKNSKQRFVPMDSSLTDILKQYRKITRQARICNVYLFESNRKPYIPFKNNTFYIWFSKVLENAGIIYVKQKRTVRGPCPHCLRHLFTKKSFIKSDSEGRRFEDTAPVLAAYLGHNSIKETEAYLRSDYSVYEQSHKRVDAAIGGLFPEVDFDAY